MFSQPVASFKKCVIAGHITNTHMNPSGQQSYELGAPTGFVQVGQEESSELVICRQVLRSYSNLQPDSKHLRNHLIL